MLGPSTVGGAGDAREGFVDGERYLRGPFLCGRAYLRLAGYSLPRSLVVRLRWRVGCLLLLVAAVYFTHHECHRERVNAGDGSACGVSRDSDGGS